MPLVELSTRRIVCSLPACRTEPQQPLIMTLSTLSVFVPTFFLVSLTPGLCMTLSLSLGMTVGVRRTAWMWIGELVGVATVAVASVIGVATQPSGGSMVNIKLFRLDMTTGDSTVIGTLRISVVAKINFTCSGGSSSVFSKALQACLESICTSSII